MKSTTPYPLILRPVYKDYIWGGTRISERYHRSDTPPVCAESWEVTDRPEGMSIITNGPLAGTTLHTLVSEWGQRLVGTHYTAGPFPLLVKVIDAAKRLSLQVHPNNETAAIYGGEAKTECWYVLDATPNAFMYAGFKNKITQNIFSEKLKTKSAEPALHAIPARKRNTVFIPGGRAHAIGEGCLLLEVQQNSNTTYRVYDWGRVGNDGKSRELHVKQAMRVINWNDVRPSGHEPRHIPSHGPNPRWELVTSDYFHLERLELVKQETVHPAPSSGTILFVEHGTVNITCGGITESLPQGTSCLIPAAAASYTLIPSETRASLVLIRLC
ncbi:MAG: class I mannose-6-phosphate isomerase [Kiritimatiellae bacterium]|nr:class I mannose-6-phosphate isomerase [Kiritimatiellia bacterium]